MCNALVIMQYINLVSVFPINCRWAVTMGQRSRYGSIETKLSWVLSLIMLYYTAMEKCLSHARNMHNLIVLPITTAGDERKE